MHMHNGGQTADVSYKPLSGLNFARYTLDIIYKPSVKYTAVQELFSRVEITGGFLPKI